MFAGAGDFGREGGVCLSLEGDELSPVDVAPQMTMSPEFLAASGFLSMEHARSINQAIAFNTEASSLPRPCRRRCLVTWKFRTVLNFLSTILVRRIQDQH